VAGYLVVAAAANINKTFPLLIGQGYINA
jgi:hypothetical protein